jgi:hypothetical protein
MLRLKKIVTLLSLLVLSVFLKAQVYHNEWIDYSAKYYKFKIYKNGIFRIDSAALAGSGINLSGLDPKKFQVFIRGKEQALFVNGEADGVFNASDYIEFYAEQNDCRFDSALYVDINFLPNPYRSLFNDTIMGFLTWNNSTTNKRLVLETDTAYSSYTPEPYFYTENIFAPPGGEYNYAWEFGGGSDPRYHQPEGYGTGIPIGNTQSSNFTNTALNMYSVTPLPASLRLVFSGASFNPSVAKDHQLRGIIYDQANNPVTLFDTIFSGFKTFKYNFNLSSAALGNSSNFELSSINNPIFGTNPWNYTIFHYAVLKYPQYPDISAKNYYRLFVDDNTSASKTYLKINNVSSGTTNTLLFYDLTNEKRIVATVNSGIAKILVPNSGNQKLCYLSAEDNVYKITSLTPVAQNGTFTNFKDPTADSAFVIVSHKNLMTEASAYKTYRQSMAGGSRNVILADIDELYDQFAWGIEKHPLSIKNFCHFLIDSLPTKPSHLFLIGKSIEHASLRTTFAHWSKCMVPSIGIPPSDNMLTAGITSTDNITPEIPVGRLAALTGNDVTNYLTKVQQHESSPPADWKKHVLHFAGGSNGVEQAYFQGCLNNYKSIIQDTLFGGRVFDFKKTTSAPIQLNITDSVKGHFNYGTSIVTFFGHGSVSGFDQAIDDPNVYQNAGKYPFMIANSCYSGNIHLEDVISNSEKFVLINQKGSIAFLASSSLGYANTLCKYSSDLYNAISRTKYNKSLGECIKEAASKSAITNDFYQQITALDMTYHGDPAIVVSLGALPDYTVNNSAVSFDTKKYVDSIGVSVIVANLGKAIHDSMMVRVERYFPGGDSVFTLKTIKTPVFKDTLKFYIPLDFTRGIGLNKFKVFIDANNNIPEQIETNNSTIGTVDLFIQGGDIAPIYPYKYAIVPNTPTLTLKASTSDPFAAQRNYRFQLDTSDAFTSPIQTALIPSGGGVVEWTVSLPFADSTVYYWRVSKDSIAPNDGFVWRESSFQVIGNKHGWGQAHFFQFKNDGYQFVKYRKPQRLFEFANDIKVVFARTAFIPFITYDQIVYSLNGGIMRTGFCPGNGWQLAVFDSISTKPWQSTSINAPLSGPGMYNAVTYSNCHCDGANKLNTFEFADGNICGNTAWQTDLQNFINSVPANNYILAYSTQYHKAESFNTSLYNAFHSFGASSLIETTPDSVNLIIFGRKGMLPGQAHEEVGTNIKSIVTLTDSMKTKWNNGYIASETIGPCFKWNSLHWRVGTVDASAGDTTIIKVIGIKPTGVRDTLATFTQDSLNVLDLYNYVNASTYPYLQLVAFMSDNIHRTSPQLMRWQVLYDEVPECAINPKKGFKVFNDTLQEGDNVTIYLPVENVGVVPFNDSLVFTYWIEDANHVNHPLTQKLKAKPFIPQAVIMDTIKINSYQFPGDNALWVDVNPPQHSRYQLEQYHFNNIARYAFSVSRDVTNPLLDVTFDGVRIMNGDIVSAKPQILVSLKDENKFLALNDTSDFTVYIKKPSDVLEQRVFFGKDLQFTPASLPSNSCKINYNPNLWQDGKYVLIVQAKDRSNNQSGAVDYRIVFEVVNKSTITQIINYPNPFSTSTRFVFNLTGSSVPDVFNIQIMTITGKIVKTIMKEDLGPLHVGRNITQYAWDGKDDFGDKLGNGVYLYKVQTKINGENIERMATEADQYFTKEIGKMVIMR